MDEQRVREIVCKEIVAAATTAMRANLRPSSQPAQKR